MLSDYLMDAQLADRTDYVESYVGSYNLTMQVNSEPYFASQSVLSITGSNLVYSASISGSYF